MITRVSLDLSRRLLVRLSVISFFGPFLPPFFLEAGFVLR